MIWEDMKESLIFRDLQVSDNKEALEILGNAMLQEGYVMEDFPVAVWQREQNFPTGLNVDGIGVAIPHTEAHHVKKRVLHWQSLKKRLNLVRWEMKTVGFLLRLLSCLR